MLPKPRSCAGPLLRAAIILTTLLTFLYSLGLSYVLWKTVSLVIQVEELAKQRGQKSPLHRGTHKLGLFPVAFMWAVLCAVSLLGLIGSLFKARAIFSKYVTLIWSHFVIDLIIGCFSIFVVFKNKDWSWFLRLCALKTAQYKLNEELCAAPLPTLRGIYVGLFFGGKVLGFGLCWLASSFLYSLRDESTDTLPVNHPLRKVYGGASQGGPGASALGLVHDNCSEASLPRKILPIEYYGPPSPSVRKPPVSRASSTRSRGLLDGVGGSLRQRQDVSADGRTNSLRVGTSSAHRYHDLNSPHAYPPTPVSGGLSPPTQEPVSAFTPTSPMIPPSTWSDQGQHLGGVQATSAYNSKMAPAPTSPSRARIGGDEPPEYDDQVGYQQQLEPNTMFDKNTRQVHPFHVGVAV